MELRILPSNIANMIAAGEVVQRPASVVKELMENAVDAGADRIDVVITDAGRTLIQVIDNGCGMTPDDAVLCFERHATSKIAVAEDLDRISTFGFRGEALASIAAVSSVTLRTRRQEDESGCEVCFAASEHISTREVSAPKGSSFAVRDLFYNVPARRKFLKSDNVEFRHISEEFTRVALTRPETGFSLTHNGREIYVLKPAKSLKFRIMDILGTSVADEVVDVSVNTSAVEIKGFVGRPDSAKKTLGNQFLFVNGRYFRSAYMHKAVMKAYEGLVPEGVTPTYFIYMTLDAGAIDVNVSPTKSEIKFEDDSVIFQVLFAAVKETLGRNSFSGSIDFDNPEAREIPVIGRKFEEYRPVSAPVKDLDPSYNPFGSSGRFREFDEGPAFGDVAQPRTGDARRYVEKREDYGKLFEDRTMPTALVLIVQGKYILSQSKSGIAVVNVRRARERILYERFLKTLSGNAHVSQTSLFPEQIRVGVENRALLDEHAELLSSLGFDITPFGSDTVVVNAVPEGFSAENGKVETMMTDLLLVLSDDKTALPDMIQSAMAEKFAMLGASGASGPASVTEAQRLLDSLYACDNPEFTSTGRKVLAIISVEELDKKF